MSESNPYQPPESEPAFERTIDPKLIDFKGGRKTLWSVALLGGAVTGVGIWYGFTAGAGFGPILVYVIPGLAWLIAFAGLAALLENSGSPRAKRILLISMLAIPAYILFVPVCTLTGMGTMMVVSDGYGPTVLGAGFASVVSFALILFLFALAIRATYRRGALPTSPVASQRTDEVQSLTVDEGSGDG